MATPARGAGGNKVSFVLPSLPGSMNELYEFNDRYSGLPRKRLKAEWALWKTRAKAYVPPCPWAIGKFLRIELDLQSPNWYYKNGKLRRKDIENFEKLTIDTIFEKIGHDDSYILEKVSRKSIGKSDQVSVILETYDKEGFRNCPSSAEVQVVQG